MDQQHESKPKTVVILFGGRSAEHEVSIRSARNVLAALDLEKYQPVPVYIRPDGRWFLCDSHLLSVGDREMLCREVAEEVVLLPGRNGRFVSVATGKEAFVSDVVFPVLHGPFGEDGTVQGLLELADVPYVGVGVLGSALGMDKDVMKRLLREAGLPVGDFRVFHSHKKDDIVFGAVVADLGLPVFVKPANLGSSVGVSRVETEEEFRRAVETAFRYDRKILVEASFQGREIECAVLGNQKPEASGVGEIVPLRDFYSYEAKYVDADGAKLAIPAEIPEEVAEEARQLAIRTFQVLECEGLGRVDFFLTEKGLFVNEINTLPGFTSVSMYPKLWEAAGRSYSELVDCLIDLALDRAEGKRMLETAR
jgi:D-alanine-D-alanine ligase